MSTFNWTVTEPPKDKVFNQIQEEMKIWQNYNFPGRPSWQPLLGIIEELGELQDAENTEERYDALGDILIYMSDYCNAINFSMISLEVTFHNKIHKIIPTIQDLLISIGKLSHSHLKYEQKIRMNEDHLLNIKEALFDIICFLRPRFTNYDIETVTWQTWLKVRERDWQKNRNTAHQQNTNDINNVLNKE